MADANDISALLLSLLSKGSAGGSGDNEQKNSEGTAENDAGGLFDELDPSVLLTILEIISKLGTQDENTAFLMALKPLLRPENRAKADRAASFLKIMSVLSLLKESGLTDNFFN